MTAYAPTDPLQNPAFIYEGIQNTFPPPQQIPSTNDGFATTPVRPGPSSSSTPSKGTRPAHAAKKSLKEKFQELLGDAAKKNRTSRQHRKELSEAVRKQLRDKIVKGRRQAILDFERENGMLPVDLEEIYQAHRDHLAINGVYTPCIEIALQSSVMPPAPSPSNEMATSTHLGQPSNPTLFGSSPITQSGFLFQPQLMNGTLHDSQMKPPSELPGAVTVRPPTPTDDMEDVVDPDGDASMQTVDDLPFSSLVLDAPPTPPTFLLPNSSGQSPFGPPILMSRSKTEGRGVPVPRSIIVPSLSLVDKGQPGPAGVASNSYLTPAERSAPRRRSISGPLGGWPLESNGGRDIPASTSGRTSVKSSSNPGSDYYREMRLRKAFRHGVLRQQRKVYANRGLDFDESLWATHALSGRQNLGTVLNITTEYSRDLDRDRDQSVPPIPSGVIPLKDPRKGVVLFSFQGKDHAQACEQFFQTFNEADRLIRSKFAEKHVTADLVRVLEDDFAVEIVRDAHTGVVLGAAEYVLMRRYLWLDAIAVENEARGWGVGVLLLNRLKHIAHARGKPILCFALNDVTGWYLAQGFRFREDFPRRPWHIGRFMSFEPAGAGEGRMAPTARRMSRCGKSSIQNVIFHKMSPNETLFLETTTRVGKDDVISFLDLQVWDFPAHIEWSDSFDASSTFKRCGSIVFIIDAQDDFLDALKRLYLTVKQAHDINPSISFEVFIHKVDGLSDDHKIETQREIHQRITDELADAGLDNIHLSFYLTSIYDHSIFEAFSKVIQKLIVQLPTLENLLNILCSNSGIEKAFLFDTFSKIYIATDSSPVDMQSYELCSDMIDVAMDFTVIYGVLGTGTAPAPERPEACSSIKLNNGMVLYMRQVDKNLSLVCLIREDNFEKKGLIDFNFNVFREAVMDVLLIRKGGVQAYAAVKEQGKGAGVGVTNGVG
ncbi:hypothetical protein HDU96_002492, partial [Phlyctochytrium bullatum]